MKATELDVYEQLVFNNLVGRGYTDTEAMNMLVTMSNPSERSECLQGYANGKTNNKQLKNIKL